MGPAIFGLVGQIMGNSRLAIISLVIFFIIGMILLSRVNEEAGVRAATEAEAEIGAETAYSIP